MPSIFSLLVQHQIKNKKRSENFAFFKACMAAAAMVAMADGRADVQERSGLRQLIGNLSKLNIYSKGHGEEIYDDFISALTKNPEKGRRKALEAIEYDGAFIFRYSARPHTAAARWEDTVPDEEKTRRVTHLLKMQRRITARKNEKWLGREVNVMVQGRSKKSETAGLARTWNEKKVVFEGSVG